MATYVRTLAATPLMAAALWLAVGQVAASFAAERVAGVAGASRMSRTSRFPHANPLTA